jgi:hypothetical protein
LNRILTRRLTRWLMAGALLTLLPAGIVSCLPIDTRPKPGRLIVTVSPDDSLESGFVTADGWSIVYEQFLLTLGNIRMEGVHGGTSGPDRSGDKTCDQYTEESTFYLRILEMRQPGPQRLATTYALGDCELGVELAPPVDEVVIGDGVDDTEREFMKAHASDPFSNDDGVTVHVAGTATKAAATKRFAWSVRRPFGYSRCAALHLQGGDAKTLDVSVRSQVFFQTRVDAADDGGAPELEFDAYAAADVNADGEVTLEELNAQRLSNGEPFHTLAERLYLGLAPRLLEFPDRVRCFDGALDRPPEVPGGGSQGS